MPANNNVKIPQSLLFSIIGVLILGFGALGHNHYQFQMNENRQSILKLSEEATEDRKVMNNSLITQAEMLSTIKVYMSNK